MVDVKPLNVVSSKWQSRAGAASQDYTNGAVAASNKYAQNASQAGPTYAAGVQEAIGRGAYAAGVNKAGAGKYQSGVQQKGSARYAGGITAGKANYDQGMQGVLNTLSGVTLPPRQARGSPANIARVAAIAQALRAAKVGGTVG